MALLRDRRPVVMVALALAAGLAGCGDDDDGGDAGPLAGRTFTSTQVTEDGARRELVEGTLIQLVFDRGGLLSATAGCNSMAGEVVVDDERLLIGELAVTEIGCDDARHDQDEWLAEILDGDPGFELDLDVLRITSGPTTIELIES